MPIFVKMLNSLALLDWLASKSQGYVCLHITSEGTHSYAQLFTWVLEGQTRAFLLA